MERFITRKVGGNSEVLPGFEPGSSWIQGREASHYAHEFNETLAETTLNEYKVIEFECYVVVVPTRSRLRYIVLQQ